MGRPHGLPGRQPVRGRRAGRPGGALRARHGDDGHRPRQDPPGRPPRRADRRRPGPRRPRPAHDRRGRRVRGRVPAVRRREGRGTRDAHGPALGALTGANYAAT
jgi:hypothetical protein